MNNARNEAKAEANLCTKTNKALGTVEQKVKELTAKLTVEEREKMSTKAGLKNSQEQAKNQHKKLHYAKIKLATARQ